MTACRLRRLGVLIAVGAALVLSIGTSAASADGEVCTTAGGCDPGWSYPAECDQITPEDQAAWDAYLYAGGPYPSRDLPYGECLGF